MHRVLAIGAAIFAAFGLWVSGALADEAHKLDVRLLPKSAVKTSDGCSFALWQRGRDPSKDKYAYVLYVGFYDAHPLPALVKIGKEVVEVQKVEPGFDGSTVNDKIQLFRSEDGKLSVLLEVLETAGDGRNVGIEEARLTFLKRDMFPFATTVKGGFGCVEKKPAVAEDAAVPDTSKPQTTKPARPALPSNLDPNGIKLDPGRPFRAFKKVPKHIVKLASGQGEACDVANTPGNGMSYPISDAMTLWQLPCALYASNASSVFVTALNGTPHANLLEIPGKPGERSNEPTYDVLNGVISSEHGVLTSSNINGASNCGTVEVFQLVEADGESVEFKLLERREKESCTGPGLDPQKFPVSYRAK